MDLEIIVWILVATVLAQGGLSLWFVNWVLWRNKSLTDLIVWKQVNGEKLDILASRFRITTPKPLCDWCGEPHNRADCPNDPDKYNLQQVEVKPITLTLED
jgi:hypothetical protein